ncbi:MAG: Vms1/Ankzf1 family peptidyl-tRNA hydrolase [Acidimicrobiia bacterium]
MTTLDDLLRAELPVASVYLQAPSGEFGAAHRFETAWKNARRDLAAAGAPDDVLEQLDVAIDGTSHDVAPAVALFADGDRPAVVEPLDDALDGDVVAFDSVPHVVPLLHTHQRTVPHVMVMTDRTGADIVAVVDGDVGEPESVDGTDHHIHRGRFGGWSHRRIQQRAENRWEDNARDVAERVDQIARQVDAQLVVVAGDVRARQFVMEHLDHRTRDIAAVVEAGDADGVATETVRLVADVVARATKRLLAEHADHLGAGTAVSGAEAVCRALTEGRVRTLLVVDDVDDDRRGHFATDGSPACSTEAVDEMAEGRLVDVMVRAALLTDAEVRVVPATVLDEDLGAILRW